MNQNKFIFATFFGLTCYLGSLGLAQAQTGYINLVLYPGNNLIANQLGSGNDTLNNLFNYKIPEGTTFTKWDAVQANFLPLSMYDVNTGWSINYGLTFGEGGELNSPLKFTNLFVGGVWPGFNVSDPYVPPLVSGTGTMLLSCYVPFRNAAFYDVIGRDPVNGESVTTLDALSQVSSTTTFQNGIWDNGTPLLNIDQSAFFKLEAVPEPGMFKLIGAGAALLLMLRQKRK